MSSRMSSKVAIHHVQVIDPTSGKCRIFCLYDGIAAEEVKALYETSFDEVKSTSGFRDENGIYYPLSLIAMQPSTVSGRRLMIVSNDHQQENNPASGPVSMIGMDSEETLLTEEQVKRSFHLLDLNGDNYVHKEEFIEFMTAAYTKLFEYDEGLAFAYSCISSKDLAVVTAMQCYNHVQGDSSSNASKGVSNNSSTYYLNYDDFCAWYMSIGFDPLRELMIRCIEYHCSGLNGSPLANKNSSLRRSKSRTQLDLGQCYTGDKEVRLFVQQCRRAFCLGKRQYLDLIRVLSGVGKPSFIISRNNLKKLVLSHIQHVGNHSPLDHYAIRLIEEFLDTIIEIADESKEDSIMLGHAISLFSVCCEDHSTETFSAVFNAYKQSHSNQYDETASPKSDGFANDLILFNHLAIVLRLLCYFNPDIVKETGCHPENLAHAIYLKFLVSIDIRRKKWGKLTLSEFIELFVHGLRVGLSMLQVSRGFFVEFLNSLLGFSGMGDRITERNSIDVNGFNDDIGVTTDAVCGMEDDMSPSFDSLEDDQVASFLVSYSGSMVTVAEARSALGLYEYSTYDVVKYLMQLCDVDSGVSQASFSRGILRLIGEHYIELTVLQRSVADFILDRLTATFDPKQQGFFDVVEMAVALLLFCEDDDQSYSRAEVILALQKSKVWKFSTVVQVISTLFKASYCLNPAVHPMILIDEAHADARAVCIEYYMTETGEKTELSPTFSNVQFVSLLNHVFEHLEKESERKRIESDIQSSTYVSESPNLNDFRSKTPQHSDEGEDALSQSIRSFSDGDSDASIPYLDDEAYPPSATVLELRAASSVMGLERYSADDLIDKLGGESNNGWLSPQTWARWFSKVIQQTEVSEFDVDIAIFLSNKIYATFTTKDRQDQVEFARIAAGLAFLCTNSPLEERLMVAFTLLDEDADGFINYNQLCTLIQSVLLVISVCSRIVSSKIMSVGATIDELAQATATEAMAALGLQLEDELNLEMLSDITEDYLKLASLV